jgi:hypothetical protein
LSRQGRLNNRSQQRARLTRLSPRDALTSDLRQRFASTERPDTFNQRSSQPEIASKTVSTRDRTSQRIISTRHCLNARSLRVKRSSSSTRDGPKRVHHIISIRDRINQIASTIDRPTRDRLKLEITQREIASHQQEIDSTRATQ